MNGLDRRLQNIFLAYSSQLAKQKRPLKDIKAIAAISRCRTEALGTGYYTCQNDHEVVAQHHSCRNRSCYLCASKSRLQWIESQRSRLFNAPHFHVVFTLPHEYLSLWRYNQALFTRIIFRASKETLLTLMSDEQYHGVTPGILMALHTWGRQLSLHPHTHCLVTAGGLTKQGQWQETGEYLLPIHVLKKLYRGKTQAFIQEAFDLEELVLPPDMTQRQFQLLHKAVYKKTWSARIEERYNHGRGVMLYLARYLKGGPFHPAQLRHCNANEIEFQYLDHRDKRKKRLSLTPIEFLNRLLVHVPQTGVHTIRYYGLYASSSKTKREECKNQLGDLSEEEFTTGTKETAVLGFCGQCGDPLRHRYSVWRRFTKGNSYIGACATEFLQQNDEAEFTKVLRNRDYCQLQV